MARPLKVFGTRLDGTNRHIVAARSMTEAARLFGEARHRIAAYTSETHNNHEISVAMARPGTVYVAQGFSSEVYKPKQGKRR